MKQITISAAHDAVELPKRTEVVANLYYTLDKSKDDIGLALLKTPDNEFVLLRKTNHDPIVVFARGDMARAVFLDNAQIWLSK